MVKIDGCLVGLPVERSDDRGQCKIVYRSLSSLSKIIMSVKLGELSRAINYKVLQYQSIEISGETLHGIEKNIARVKN